GSFIPLYSAESRDSKRAFNFANIVRFVVFRGKSWATMRLRLSMLLAGHEKAGEACQV
ncbi:hypothetical protein WUBG_14402, partial [Wuchereria bancrofti]